MGVNLFAAHSGFVLLGRNHDWGAVVDQLLPQGYDPAGQPLAFHLHPVAFANAHFYLAPGDRSSILTDDENTALVITDGQRLLRDDGGLRHPGQYHRGSDEHAGFESMLGFSMVISIRACRVALRKTGAMRSMRPVNCSPG
jgi:hypothetical protein